MSAPRSRFHPRCRVRSCRRGRHNPSARAGAGSRMRSDTRRTTSPDPREPPRNRDLARTCSSASIGADDAAEHLAHWWIGRLVRLARTGVSGFRCLRPDRVPAGIWRDIISGVRADAPQCCFLAWTPGVARDAIGQLAGVGFDYVGSSLAWWDARASWLAEEADALRHVAPTVVPRQSRPLPSDHGITP